MFTLKPPIYHSDLQIYNRQFGTLPFGILLSNLDTGYLKTYPRIYYGNFLHLSILMVPGLFE